VTVPPSRWPVSRVPGHPAASRCLQEPGGVARPSRQSPSTRTLEPHAEFRGTAPRRGRTSPEARRDRDPRPPPGSRSAYGQPVRSGRAVEPRRSPFGLRDVALTPVSRSWKPAGSVFWCGQDLGSIEGHYRALADSKHPFDRTSFGTPRTGGQRHLSTVDGSALWDICRSPDPSIGVALRACPNRYSVRRSVSHGSTSTILRRQAGNLNDRRRAKKQ